MTGLPIGLAFANYAADLPYEQRRYQARARPGLAPELPLALLAGGAEGVGRLQELAGAIAERLYHTGTRAQMAVMAGRNDGLKARLERQQWPLPVHVLGYTHHSADWMAAADCLVTKAGPATIAEALALGLPLLLTGFVAGQEDGNVSFVVEEQVGVYRPQPDEVAATVTSWLTPGNVQVQAMAQKALRLAQPQASLTIARLLHQLL